MSAPAVPRAFVIRRLHSLMGLWLTLFLFEHLLVNSQAALWVGEKGRGFVEMVNSIHNLPYLEVLELILLGVPILFHAVWGIRYLFTAKMNSFPTARNWAYSFQRITSWILLIGLLAHVAKFRFLDYPASGGGSYFVRLSLDNGLYSLAPRLGYTLYDQEAIVKAKSAMVDQSALQQASELLLQQKALDSNKAEILEQATKQEHKRRWLSALMKRPVHAGQVIAETKDFGTASLLSVRDTFKNPLYIGLYTLFVLAACFHAFNGLWTFLISWGVILRMAAQRTMVGVATALMLLTLFFGLAALYGTYFITLRS